MLALSGLVLESELRPAIAVTVTVTATITALGKYLGLMRSINEVISLFKINL